MWEKVFGAALAGVFGIISAIYLDLRKEEIDRRVACGTIARELKWICEWRQFLLSCNYKSAVFGRFVPTNSFSQYRSLLEPAVLSDSEIAAVEAAYRDFERRDRVIQVFSSISAADGPGALKRGTAEATFWHDLGSVNAEKSIEGLSPIIDRLLARARRPAWFQRLWAKIRHALAI